MSNFLIIADGSSIKNDKLLSLSKDKIIIVLDGAANKLININIVPHFIVGDFDQISQETKNYYQEKGVNILHLQDQNFTDLEKAIIFCESYNPNSIFITNALGKRTDHMLGNISCLKKFYKSNRPIYIISNKEKISFVKDQEIIITGEIKDIVAILGFPECSVLSDGLEYDMNNYQLTLGGNNSICNSLNKNKAIINIKGEAIIIQPL
jgi:thiamine pyrophosphokinase